jgi:hypothetical protein
MCLVGYYLSPCSRRGPRVVIWRVIHPEEALLLGVVSVPFHEDVIVLSFLEYKVIVK